MGQFYEIWTTFMWYVLQHVHASNVDMHYVYFV